MSERAEAFARRLEGDWTIGLTAPATGAELLPAG